MWRRILKEVLKALAVEISEIRPDQWIAAGAYLTARLESLSDGIEVAASGGPTEAPANQDG